MRSFLSWIAVPRRALMAPLVLLLVGSSLTPVGASGATPPVGDRAATDAVVSAASGGRQATRVRLGELGILGGAGYYLAIENGTKKKL